MALEGLGALNAVPGTVVSAVYGTLGFATPVAELDLERCTPAEAEAYARFRDRYQQSWRQWFDPIALQVRRGADGAVGLDLTVMPLIAGSDYRDLVAVTGESRLAADAGDPHQGTIAHWALAIDRESPPVRQLTGLAAGMAPGLRDPFAWLGTSVAIYAEAGPWWDELAAAPEPEQWVEAHLAGMPLALRVDVADPLRLAAFLTGLHALADQSAPGLTRWETREHDGRSYVRVAAADGEQPWSLFYAATPKALLLTLDEALLRRALAREAARAAGDAVATPPWLGAHAGLRLDAGAVAPLLALGRLMGEDPGQLLRHRAWDALPVLAEWRRRWPDHDPLAVHERILGVRPACPAGGSFAWDAAAGEVVSTLFGAPLAPRSGPALPPALQALISAAFGLTFEHDGLRAQVELRPQATAASTPMAVPAR